MILTLYVPDRDGAIPYKSGIYSNVRKQKKTKKIQSASMSQSLINQGYIPMEAKFVQNFINYSIVAIPYKSGIYSNTTFCKLLESLINLNGFS